MQGCYCTGGQFQVLEGAFLDFILGFILLGLMQVRLCTHQEIQICHAR